MLLLLLVFAVAPPCARGTPPQGYNPHWHFDPYVGASSNWSASNVTHYYPEGYYGNFSSDGHVITFFICDSANYAKFLANPSDPTLVLYQRQTSSSGNFTLVSSSDTYYVFYNTDEYSGVQCHLDLYWDLWLPVVTVTLTGTNATVTLPQWAYGIYVNSSVSGVLVVNVTAVSDYFPMRLVYLAIGRVGSWTVKEFYGMESMSMSVSYTWDTTQASNGNYTIHIQCMNTAYRTMYIDFIVNVQNPPSSSPVFAVIIAVAIVAIFGAVATASVILRISRGKEL